MISGEALKEVLVQPVVFVREALKQMDKAGLEVLIVIDKTGRLLGIVTDVDVLKALIKNIGFKNNHKYFMQEASAMYVQSKGVEAREDSKKLFYYFSR
jgi:CBS domain containing-hemolysin-like protein